jgi:hypothetical protein
MDKNLLLLVVNLPNGSDFPKPVGNMGRSPNYGRKSNILIPDPYYQWLTFYAPELTHRKPMHG